MKNRMTQILALTGWAGLIAVTFYLVRKPPVQPVPQPEPPGRSAPEKPGPRLEGEIDFSGTGLADEAWQLPPDQPDAEPALKIPDKIPGAPGGDESAPAPGPAPMPPADWNPDSTLKLDIRPGPASR